MPNTKKDTTENQIPEAAESVFQRMGMDESRMQEITDETEINKALLHYYYRSKQRFFKAISKNSFALLAPQLNRILNDYSAIEDKIRDFTVSSLTFMNKHPYLPKFIIHDINRNPEFILKMKEVTGFPNLDKFKKKVANEVESGAIKTIKPEHLFINHCPKNLSVSGYTIGQGFGQHR
jgi:hypothetical protein